MKRHLENLGIALCGAVLVLATAGQSLAGPFDSAEAKCRKDISKNVQKALKTGSKTITKCHKSRNKGKVLLAVDCNDMAQADDKLKFDKAKNKLVSAVQKSCVDSGIDDDVMDFYNSCTSTCTASESLPNPLTVYTDLATCLGCMVEELVETNHATILGLPTDLTADKDGGKCHGTIAKGWSKHLLAYHKERTKCQDTAEGKAGACGLDDTDCATDTITKIDDAAGKAASGVTGKCTDGDLPGFNLTGGCSAAATTGDLNACALAQNGTDGSGDGGTITAATYELEGEDLCPIAVDSLIRAGTGIAGTTATRLDVGWTGEAHGGDLADDYFLSVDVTCPGAPGDCADGVTGCTVDGISPTGPQYSQFLRCKSDSTIECSNAFGADAACGGGPCVYTLGPPLPLSAGNNPVCVINQMSVDITGTLDPDAGSADLNLKLDAVVYLGEGVTKPCPTCDSDLVAADGNKDGTCSSGPNAGGACDVQAFSATFAAQANNEGTSLDCPSSPGQNISGTGLALDIPFTTGSSSLGFDLACDSPLGFLDCACGVCSLSSNPQVPCRNNADCGVGDGTCTSNGGGQAVSRQPNKCSNLVCTDLDGTFGECAAMGGGDTLTYCDGDLRANGEGYIACNSNADCSPLDTECSGGDCGNCTVTTTRPCFVDPIVATGVVDPDNPTIAATFCLTPTGNAAINGVSGSPGPARVWTDTVVSQRYK